MSNNNSEASPPADSSVSQYHHYDCMALACGESGSLNIISQLNGLYEDRVKNIETKTGHSANDPLVHTLKSWITDLNVQNAELVNALEDLERETACRVKLLEEKFKGTSNATKDYMAKAQDFNSQMQSVPTGSGQDSEDSTRIGHLKSDVRNLCRLIQQGRENDNWSTDDFIFFEVTLEEIFGTYPFTPKLTKLNENTSESQGIPELEEDCGCDVIKQQLEEKNKALEALRKEMKIKDAELAKLGLELSEFNRTQENIDGELTDRNSVIGSLEKDLMTMREHMALKDEQIISLIQKIQELRDDLQEKSCTVNMLLQKASEASQDQDCTCVDEEDPALQGDPVEILQNTLQTTDCELEQIQQDIEKLLSDDLGDGTSPAKELLALIGEHTAIVDELNSRSKNLQGALDKARTQIRTMSENNVDRKLANQLPSKEEQQVVLDEYCKKTLQLEEELERSRAQVQSIKGDLKSKETRIENQTKYSHSSEKTSTLRFTQKNQLAEDDLCSCQPKSQPGKPHTSLQVEELERQVAHQQVTIGNLQKALLSTKHQLEDLQGRGSFEVSVGGSSSSWSWPKGGATSKNKRTVHDV